MEEHTKKEEHHAETHAHHHDAHPKTETHHVKEENAVHHLGGDRKETEVHHSMQQQRSNTAFWVLAIALALLVIISGVQAIELTKLKNQLKEEGASLSLGSQGAASSSSKLKSSLDSLPSMVGGC